MSVLSNLGMQAGSAAIGGIMGLALGGINDQRQLTQQQKLQNMQIQGSKELTDYNMSKQLQMWKDTGYGAQIQQMKDAHLSPALIYGGGGGGGQSMGTPNSNVGSGQAPQGGGEIMGMVNIGIQQQMLKIQDKLADIQDKSVTNQNSNRDTATEAEAGYKKAQTSGQQIENSIKATASENIIRQIGNMADKTWAEMYQITQETQFEGQLLPHQIEQLKAIISEKNQNVKVGEQDVKNMQQQISNMQQDIRESIQRIGESKIRMNHLNASIELMAEQTGATEAEKYQIQAATDNLIRTGSLLDYEKELQDKGLRNPLVQGSIDVVKEILGGAAQGYGAGKGVGGGIRKAFNPRTPVGFKF